MVQIESKAINTKLLMMCVKISKITPKMIDISVDVFIITVIMVMSRDFVERKREGAHILTHTH